MPRNKQSLNGVSCSERCDLRFTAADALDALTKDTRLIAEFRESMRVRCQDLMNLLSGNAFGQESQAVAIAFQQLLNSQQFRLKCPAENCGDPAILRWVPNSSVGSYQFEHSSRGKKKRHSIPKVTGDQENASVPLFPWAEVVDAPPDRRLTSNRGAENVAWAQELLAGLRHRFALILNDRHERKVSGGDDLKINQRD